MALLRQIKASPFLSAIDGLPDSLKARLGYSRKHTRVDHYYGHLQAYFLHDMAFTKAYRAKLAEMHRTKSYPPPTPLAPGYVRTANSMSLTGYVDKLPIAENGVWAVVKGGAGFDIIHKPGGLAILLGERRDRAIKIMNIVAGMAPNVSPKIKLGEGFKPPRDLLDFYTGYKEAISEGLQDEYLNLAASTIPRRTNGSKTCPPNALTFYHGAQRWEGAPTVVEHRKGHAEHGPGIYLTTSWQTADKYAKGGGSVYRVKIDPSAQFLQDAAIDVDDAREFVKSLPRLRAKADILETLARSEARRGKDLPAEYLINAFVNNDAASGQHGPALAAFLVEHGADISIVNNSSSEDWAVVFNPDKICSVERLERGETSRPDFAFDLPKVARQIA